MRATCPICYSSDLETFEWGDTHNTVICKSCGFRWFDLKTVNDSSTSKEKNNDG